MSELYIYDDDLVEDYNWIETLKNSVKNNNKKEPKKQENLENKVINNISESKTVITEKQKSQTLN